MNMQELSQHQFDSAELRQVFVADAAGAPQQSKHHKAVYNINKGQIAAVVSDRYKLVQHREMVRAVSAAITDLNINAAAEVKEANNRLFVDIEFADSKLYVDKGEEFIAGLRIINSYDKSTGITVTPRLKRLVCLNGMVIQTGFVREYSITHIKSLREDFSAVVEKMLNAMINNNDKLKAMVNDCIGDSIEWELLDKILSRLCWHTTKHIDAIKKKLAEIEKPTRWDVYNAFTNYATHGQHIKPNVEAELQKRANKLLVTPLQLLVPTEAN